MQKERFDIALHFQGNGISANPFLNKLNAKLTAGVACNDAVKLDRSIPFYYYQNEVMRYIEVASLIGANSCDTEPRLLVMDNDKKEVNALISLMSKPFVVLHPAAKDIRRSWPFSNYVPIANWLLQKGFEVVITGSADDKKLVERIIAGVDGKVYNTCGSLTLG